MEILLLMILAGLGIAFLRHRHRARALWAQILRMTQQIHRGQRPRTFILHGEENVRRIGLALESLADERERLTRQISQEGFNTQAILSSMEEGVLIVDTGRTIQLVNPSFLKLFELHRSPVGKPALQVLRNAEIEDGIATALRTGEAQVREVELTFSQRRLALSAAPVRDDARGKLLGAVVLLRDVTRVRQLEEVRREFVANVSHELRTPLSIFQGYLEMLSDHPELPREETTAAVEVLRRHSDRLNLLVEDLLSLARLEGRQETFEMGSVAIPALLEEVREDWKLKFAQREVALHLDLPPGLPAIEADRARMQQVFSNLLENALKYTGEGGTVALEARACDGEGDGGAGRGVEIRVRDSGQGIDPANLPHIFERFYRADKARSRQLGGTGLGLSIVKHLIQAQGGEVRAESRPGEGTTIILRLPCVKTPQP